MHRDEKEALIYSINNGLEADGIRELWLSFEEADYLTKLIENDLNG